MLQIGNSLGTSSDYKIKPKKETRVAKESTLWKIKVHKYRERNKRFLDRYRECLKEATWINGVVDPDSLPPDVRAYFWKRRGGENTTGDSEKLSKKGT